MADKKKFGLVMPKKLEAFKVKKNSVFNDDSDEDERVSKRPKIPQKKINLKSKLKSDSMEDPSIYEYDDIYDEMKRKQTESIAPKEKKNSRYIETLMKAAEKRKKEYERRIDKKIQVEREKEGDQFKDKEAFVTSSYKKKMLEQEEEEQKERRENMLNDMMDVTKQKDLSGFYRHFLKQTVGEEKVPQFGDRQIKTEKLSDEDSSQKHGKTLEDYENLDRDSDNVEIDGNESSKSDEKSDTENQRGKESSDIESQKNKYTEQNLENRKLKTFQSRKRSKKHYRKSARTSSLSSSSTDDEENTLPIQKSICSDKNKKSVKSNVIKLPNSRHDSSSASDGDEVNKKTTADKHCNESINVKMSSDTDKDCSKNISEKKPRVNIYAKRTVGDTFAEAQARYFQRMALGKA